MHFHTIVIGAGPAGLACSVRLAQLGSNVAIVERDYLGGICINWGCTPSKAMIQSAKVAKYVAHANHYGVNVSNWNVEFPQVAVRRDDVIVREREELAALLEHHNVTVFQGEADPIGNNTVRIKAGQLDREGKTMNYTGEETELTYDHLVLATGSAPRMPGFVGTDDSIVSSNRLITIDELPEDLTIIGGGIIGMEFATIFSELGSEVTIIEYCDRILNGCDAEVSSCMTAILENKGVEVLCNKEVTKAGNGEIEMKDRKTGDRTTRTAPLTLVSIGRTAIVKEEWCNTLGIEFTKRGITVDDYLHTNAENVWAIGDTTGKSILAHAGIKQGEICAENIMSLDELGMTQKSNAKKMDYSVIPAAVYTLPEIATVGDVPEDLSGIEVTKVPFAANLRASIEEKEEGFLKIWTRGNTVVAAQMIGENASELIQELANMIALQTPIEDVANIIHAHPTLGEITKTALNHVLGKATDYFEK